MAKQTKTFYVHAYYNEKGKFSGFTINDYKMDHGMGQYGMWILLHTQVVEYEVPDDMRSVDTLAATELEAFIKQEQGKHHLKMMQLQAMVNSMRGLGHSEVLDAPKRGEFKFSTRLGDDDLPF